MGCLSSHWRQETARAEQPSNALARLTACFSGAQIEATARRTGLVQRTSNLTGTRFLALITVGSWSDAKTSVAPWAAKAPPLGTAVAVSPAALYQRMNKRALAFLQELIGTALAKIQAGAPVCAERLLTPLARGHLADRTGVGLPDRRQDTCPGAGGSAAPAGAKLQLGWEYQQRVCTQFARIPWNMPDQQYLATVVAFAQSDDVLLLD